MCFVRWEAAAIMIAGSAMISTAPLWVVLADPRFVEVEPVEVLEELQVLFQRKRRVVADAVVQRRHEHTEFHTGRSISH